MKVEQKIEKQHLKGLKDKEKVEDESMVGPNSVVPPGRLIPSHQLWAGNPVKYVRDLTKAEIWTIKVLANQK